MNNDNLQPAVPATQSRRLRSIAGELMEVHSLLSALCDELGGGGIVYAKHVEPLLASAVPKLSDAVQAMNELTADPADGPNPLLM